MMNEGTRGAVRLPRPPETARKVGVGRRGHFSGFLNVGEGEGQAMEVESHTEMQIAQVLLSRPDVAAVENQVPFAWLGEDGIGRTHFFDFRVTHRDGERTAIMVKAGRRLSSARFMQEARRIAGQVTPGFADRVRLMTERDLDPVELHNAELLHGVREADPEADAAARRVVSTLTGAARVGDLVAATGREGRGWRAVCRPIRSRELALVRRERIANEALVRREAA